MLIYLIYCPKSCKGYVGQTTRSLKRRWSAHRTSARSGSFFPVHAAIRKYGENAFELSVLATASTLDELSVLETHHIEAQNTLTPNGYNLTTGGEKPHYSAESRAKIVAANANRVVANETRIKMSAAHAGRKHSFESKAKMSAALKGRKISPEWKAKLSAAAKGRRVSPEARAKIGAASKGRRPSPETRVKLSAWQIGRTRSLETRAKISAARKGKKFPHKGHSISLETRAKISAALRAKRDPLKIEVKYAQEI